MTFHFRAVNFLLNTLKAACSVLALLLLVSCGTVKTKVNTFKAPDWAPQGGTFTVAPLDGQLESSLEFAHYRGIVERVMQSKGFTLAEPNSAEYVVLMGYNIAESTVNDVNPRSSVFLGAGTSARYGNQTNVIVTETNGRRVYQRLVNLIIAMNNAEQTRVYEAKGQSLGGCSVLSSVFSPIVEAIMQDFPGADGDVKKVSVEGSESC